MATRQEIYTYIEAESALLRVQWLLQRNGERQHDSSADEDWWAYDAEHSPQTALRPAVPPPLTRCAKQVFLFLFFRTTSRVRRSALHCYIQGGRTDKRHRHRPVSDNPKLSHSTGFLKKTKTIKLFWFDLHKTMPAWLDGYQCHIYSVYI